MATMTGYTATNMDLENFNARYLAATYHNVSLPSSNGGSIGSFPILVGQYFAFEMKYEMQNMTGFDRIYIGDGFQGNNTDGLLAGTITTIIQDNVGMVYDPEIHETYADFVQTYAINGMSLDAATMHAAELTSDTVDDFLCYALLFAGNDTFTMSDEADRIYAYSGNDTMNGNGGNDYVDGGAGSDSVYGGAGDDSVFGNSSTDRVFGGDGNDSVYGGSGNDTMQGNAGADKLYGGAGADQMAGGAGNDVFVLIASSDTGNLLGTADFITDFTHLKDRIDVSAIDAFTNSQANDTFVWRGTDIFNKATAGEVRFEKFDLAGTKDDYTMVYFDTNADSASEFQIKLDGLITLTAADFAL